jgi:hypothetical protein
MWRSFIPALSFPTYGLDFFGGDIHRDLTCSTREVASPYKAWMSLAPRSITVRNEIAFGYASAILEPASSRNQDCAGSSSGNGQTSGFCMITRAQVFHRRMASSLPGEENPMALS